MKPKCTIFGGWTGPECGADAISLNDWGGFQCKFHDELPRCKNNKVGPVKEIAKDDPNAETLLQEAYDNYLSSHQEKSGTDGSRTTIAAHNAPQSMKRS